MRRNRPIVAAGAALLVTAVISLAVSTVLVTREQRQTAVQRDIATEKSLEATEAARTLERELYMSRVNLAQREWTLNNVGLTNALLDQCPPRLRGWEWAYCHWLGHMERLTLRAAADNPGAAEWSLRGVYGLAYSPDGRRLASSGADYAVTLWEVDTGKVIRVLRGHRDVVLAVAFSPDGSLIATGSKDTTIRIWDASTGTLRYAMTGTNSWVRALAFNPDGTRLASGSGAYPAAPNKIPEIGIWDVPLGHKLHIWRGHTEAVQDIAWSPDGSIIASASQDDTVKLWDAASGRELRTLQGHTHDVYGVAFSPNGTRIASAGFDRVVILWDARSGGLLQKLSGHEGWVTTVAFSPDGRRLVSGGDDTTLRLWDPATGRPLSTVRGHTASVSFVRFNLDGSEFASCSEDGTIRIWDTEVAVDGESRQIDRFTFTGTEGGFVWASRVVYSPDGRKYLTTSGDWRLRIWDSATGRKLREFPKWINGTSAFSPDGKRIAVTFAPDSRDDRNLLRIFDAETGRLLASSSGPASTAIAAVAFDPRGTLVAGACSDSTVRLWDAVRRPRA